MSILIFLGGFVAGALAASWVLSWWFVQKFKPTVERLQKQVDDDRRRIDESVRRTRESIAAGAR